MLVDPNGTSRRAVSAPQSTSDTGEGGGAAVMFDLWHSRRNIVKIMPVKVLEIIDFMHRDAGAHRKTRRRAHYPRQ